MQLDFSYLNVVIIQSKYLYKIFHCFYKMSTLTIDVPEGFNSAEYARGVHESLRARLPESVRTHVPNCVTYGTVFSYFYMQDEPGNPYYLKTEWKSGKSQIQVTSAE